MGYSINLYLDRAISEKELTRLHASQDQTARKEAELQIATKPLQIFLYLRFPKNTLKVFVERKATQKQWDAGKQRVNPNFYKAGPSELNQYLGNLLNDVQKLHEANLLVGKQTTREQLREIVDKLNLKEKETGPKAVSLDEAYKEFLRLADHLKAANTKKNYVTVWNHLVKYTQEKRKPLDFSLFTSSFPNTYSEYLGQKAELGYNTIGKHLRILKTFLFFATDERNYNQLQEFRKWKALSEKEKEIYTLTKEELMKLYKHEFEHSRHAQVRDVFCFACFTGLRFSDVDNLKWEAIKKDHIKVLPVKTRHRDSKAINIPLNSFAQEILARYKGKDKPLPVISSQKSNEYLKEIGQLLEFKDPVKVLKHVGSSTKEEYVEKWQILTFHVARKTFITTSLILGMPERVVREFSGHKSEKDFAKYVKLADTFKEQQMHQAWNEDAFKEKPASINMKKSVTVS
ncbi:site-specific integrase [Adhaeribacter soli]|uniref:Tyrosine-type recombinase/integrase n=1 Tax=Adhaeribacter soli TaxID=2607655 RepID=A0A5N1J2E8_9BACT|nr:site-specific integrase [Adhaeribacter soli]KAA9338802.1 tyrosine-type recombinase/integrase [Adhaeribacter soli]